MRNTPIHVLEKKALNLGERLFARMLRPGRVAWFHLTKLSARDEIPILCPSTGRVGSTILWKAIAEARAKNIFGSAAFENRRLIGIPAWDLKALKFRRGAVYKTHALPHGLAPAPPLKIIFLYGCPSNSVLSTIRCYSTKGPLWVERHFARMHANGSYGELIHRDVLRLGEQIDAWCSLRDVDLLALKYESLWENLDLLGNFVGFPVELPPRKERDFSDLPLEIVAAVRNTYRQLDEKVASLPDSFLSTRK